MTAPDRLLHLALREAHAAAGGRFEVRAGWSLPTDYGDSAAEYAALRAGAVVFDGSQRSRILVTGTDAQVVLARAFAGHVDELEEGRAVRGVALDEQGLIRDLALIARTGGIAHMVLGEPGQRWESLERLRQAAGEDFDVQIDDRTETTCLIGLAGPRAADVAAEHFPEARLGGLGALQCAAFQFHGFRGMAIRASDTGEDGFLLMLAPAVAQHVIETMKESGVPLAGSVAIECARVEACIPAFEPDLEPGLTPAEADLDVILDVPGGGSGRILSALVLDVAEPVWAGSEVRFEGDLVGQVRSCVHSIGLSATIGLGIISAQAALPGREFDVAGSHAAVVAKPFLRRRQV